jgi:hypothetical protein
MAVLLHTRPFECQAMPRENGRLSTLCLLLGWLCQRDGELGGSVVPHIPNTILVFLSYTIMGVAPAIRHFNLFHRSLYSRAEWLSIFFAFLLRSIATMARQITGGVCEAVKLVKFSVWCGAVAVWRCAGVVFLYHLCLSTDVRNCARDPPVRRSIFNGQVWPPGGRQYGKFT